MIRPAAMCAAALALGAAAAVAWGGQIGTSPAPPGVASGVNGSGPAAARVAGGLSDSGSGADIDSPAYWRESWEGLSSLGTGFLAWESNRGGNYRIWVRNLDGSGLRQLSPDEEGRDHFCAHISPDGKKLVYLSYPEGQTGWHPTPPGAQVPMHLISTDRLEDRIIVENARTYQEHRAAVWINEKELIYIDSEGYTAQLNLVTGKHLRLTRSGSREFGWLLNAAKMFATRRHVSFSPFDEESGTISQARQFGGCQPYFSTDGVWGYWVSGSGGPISRIHLASGRTSQILDKGDPRIPKERSTMYFPMLSSNGLLFAFAASPGHVLDYSPRSDFDIFVAQSDPATLEIIGRPARYTFAPFQDRFPDVFISPHRSASSVSRREPSQQGSAIRESWPTSRAGLVFLWKDAGSPNLVTHAGTGRARTFVMEPRGRSWVDRNHAMHLTGEGAFVSEEAGAEIAGRCGSSGAMSLELTLAPAPQRAGKPGVRQAEPGRLITLEGGTEGENFSLGLAGAGLRIRMNTTGGDTPGEWTLPLRTGLDRPPGRPGPRHLVVVYEPGRMTAYVNGLVALDTAEIQGNLAEWDPGPLVAGWQGGSGVGWRGTLEGIAVYDRVLGKDEVVSNYRRYRLLTEGRSSVARVEVQAKLAAQSPAPAVEDLGSYRSALVINEYQAVKILSGAMASSRFLVAQWAILDRTPLNPAGLNEGDLHLLVLEPFEANRQLESFPLVNSLGDESGLPLYFEVGF